MCRPSSPTLSSTSFSTSSSPSSNSLLYASFITFVLIVGCTIGYSFVAFILFSTPVPTSNGIHLIQGPVVKTTHGRVEGLYSDRLGRKIETFLGIPYALPPIGNQRFARPAGPIKWKHTLKATRKTPACMQHKTTSLDLPWVPQQPIEESEDCLMLNIWTPNSSSGLNVSRHVLIFIPGGGFVSGHIRSPEFDGSVLASFTDSVVAMMNYRVGVLGFLNIDNTVAGNQGLYDQVMALKWIKNNAASFGGNPDQITLFGESAGAASVGFHLVSPLSQNLFKRAIMQSGSGLMPVSLVNMDQVHALGQEVINHVGCNLDNVTTSTSINSTKSTNVPIDPYDQKDPETERAEEVVNCLKETPLEKLLEAQSIIIKRKDDTTFGPTFYDDFLPENPIDMMRKGNFSPNLEQVLMGYNKDEGSVFMYFSNPQKYPAVGRDKQIDTNITLDEVMTFATRFMKSQNPVTTKNLLNSLYSGENETTIFNATRVNVGEFFVVCPTIFAADDFVVNNVSVYFYHFVHRPKNTPWAEWVGSTHFEEVQFIFGMPLIKQHLYTKEEVRLSKKMMHTWASFARTGIPTHQANIQWPLYRPEDPKFVEISAKQSRIKKGLPQKKCNFWRLTYEVTHSQNAKDASSTGDEDEEGGVGEEEKDEKR